MKWYTEILTTEEVTSVIGCEYPNCDWTNEDGQLLLVGGKYYCEYHHPKQIEHLSQHCNMFRLANCLFNTISFLLYARAMSPDSVLLMETDGRYKLTLRLDTSGNFPTDTSPMFTFTSEDGLYTLTAYTNEGNAYHMLTGVNLCKNKTNAQPLRELIKQTALTVVEINTLFSGTLAELEEIDNYEVATAKVSEMVEFAKDKVFDFKVKLASIFGQLNFTEETLFNAHIPDLALAPRFIYSLYPLLWDMNENGDELF